LTHDQRPRRQQQRKKPRQRRGGATGSSDNPVSGHMESMPACSLQSTAQRSYRTRHATPQRNFGSAPHWHSLNFSMSAVRIQPHRSDPHPPTGRSGPLCWRAVAAFAVSLRPRLTAKTNVASLPTATEMISMFPMLIAGKVSSHTWPPFLHPRRRSRVYASPR